jgi:hypothetical protein
MVRELSGQGKGVKQIAAILDRSPATISYHKSRLGYPRQRHCAKRYDWCAVQAYYDQGHSRRECQAHFGFCPSSWSDAVARGDIVPRPYAMPFEKLLIKGPRNRHNIKLRLLAAGLKRNRCETCGISEWQDQPLSLALHHRNGDPHDNRLENLALLCPNCHSQTPNFAAKKRDAVAAAVA